MKNRCFSCGTTNWADAKVCIRCSKSLDALTGIERLEAQSGRKGMPLGVYLIMGLAAFFVVFVGIKMVKDGRAETARVEAKKKADTEKAAVDQKFWADLKAASDKQMLEMNEQMKSDMKQQHEGLSRTNFDSQQMLRNPPAGGWGGSEKFREGYQIPPPGTVYEHRNGQMHQVR